MQRSMVTFASLAAMAAVAVLSVPTQAKAYHYGHGHGHGHFGHGHGHGYGGHEYVRCNCGWVRINLEPRESRNEAQVLVDGAHAGAVDDFDGLFQRLALPPGGARDPDRARRTSVLPAPDLRQQGSNVPASTPAGASQRG